MGENSDGDGAVRRRSMEYYGLTRGRVKELNNFIRSGKYASLVSKAAHRLNKDIAGYILQSVIQNESYDVLRAKWELGEIERIPYGRSDFYGIRRYFYSLIDKELRRMGK